MDNGLSLATDMPHFFYQKIQKFSGFDRELLESTLPGWN
jgi:hypothetical protein